MHRCLWHLPLGLAKTLDLHFRELVCRDERVIHQATAFNALLNFGLPLGKPVGSIGIRALRCSRLMVRWTGFRLVFVLLVRGAPGGFCIGVVQDCIPYDQETNLTNIQVERSGQHIEIHRVVFSALMICHSLRRIEAKLPIPIGFLERSVMGCPILV